MKRTLDVVVSVILLILLAVPMVLIAVAVKLTSKGPALHWSSRIGRENRVFRMPKFRSMRADAPQITTHLLCDPRSYLTPIGGFLRRTSLDELPQLLLVLHGDMSLVGPRPALFNQHDLIALRTTLGIHRLVPGITGWAQVNGRDKLPITTKANFDYEYLQSSSFWFDINILFMTVWKVASHEGVSH